LLETREAAGGESIMAPTVPPFFYTTESRVTGA